MRILFIIISPFVFLGCAIFNSDYSIHYMDGYKLAKLPNKYFKKSNLFTCAPNQEALCQLYGAFAKKKNKNGKFYFPWVFDREGYVEEFNNYVSNENIRITSNNDALEYIKYIMDLSYTYKYLNKESLYSEISVFADSLNMNYVQHKSPDTTIVSCINNLNGEFNLDVTAIRLFSYGVLGGVKKERVRAPYTIFNVKMKISANGKLDICNMCETGYITDDMHLKLYNYEYGVK